MSIAPKSVSIVGKAGLWIGSSVVWVLPPPGDPATPTLAFWPILLLGELLCCVAWAHLILSNARLPTSPPEWRRALPSLVPPTAVSLGSFLAILLDLVTAGPLPGPPPQLRAYSVLLLGMGALSIFTAWIAKWETRTCWTFVYSTLTAAVTLTQLLGAGQLGISSVTVSSSVPWALQLASPLAAALALLTLFLGMAAVTFEYHRSRALAAEGAPPEPARAGGGQP